MREGAKARITRGGLGHGDGRTRVGVVDRGRAVCSSSNPQQQQQQQQQAVHTPHSGKGGRSGELSERGERGERGQQQAGKQRVKREETPPDPHSNVPPTDRDEVPAANA